VYRLWYDPFIVDEAVDNVPPEKRNSVRYYVTEKREMGICYAESDDGLVWRKPELGLIEYGGDRRNNIVKRPTHGAGVEKDPSDPDPARRYKMLTCQEDKPDQMAVAFSTDGLRWSEYVPCPSIGARGDTHNNFFWSASRGVYVGLTRLWDKDQRLVGRTQSADFIHWTKATEIMRGLTNEPHRQVYELLGFTWENLYLGFVMVFDTAADTVDCELAWSPDTVRWERVCPGTPIIPRGPQGSFDCGCIYAAKPIIRDGTIRLYYGGSDGPHTNWRKGGLGLAYLPMNRFAGIGPEDRRQPGVVTTVPVVWDGKDLTITADVDGGYVRVGVLGDAELTLEECLPVKTSIIDGQVVWRGKNTQKLRGKQVRLVFEVQNARLYGFSFRD
jgi:hypothetical protein